MLHVNLAGDVSRERETLLGLDSRSVTTLTREGLSLVQPIKALWTDDGVQACFAMRSRYQLSDSVDYFMKHLDRVAAECEERT